MNALTRLTAAATAASSLLLVAPHASAQPRPSAPTLAITGATVIDATGRAPIADGTVLIRDGRIAAVGAAAQVSIPAGATRIDGRGKYVIPGLMDANLHLYLNADLESLIRYEDRYHEIVLEGAQIALKAGMTTVFDTWGPRAAIARARDMINAGQAPGSRIYFAGNIIGFSGPLGPDFFGAAAATVTKQFARQVNSTWEEGTGRELMWMPPDTLRAAIRRYLTTGVDFLKFGGSGHVEMSFVSFSERQQRAIVEEGHKAGKVVQAHVTSPESIDMAVDAGVDILTHGDISGSAFTIPQETLDKIAQRGTYVSSLAITARSLDALRTSAPNGVLTPYMVLASQNVHQMVKRGVKLLVSTDAGVEDPVRLAESPTLAADTIDARVKLGEGHFNALLAFEEAGMAPMEILRSATANVATAYRLDRDIGTLEAGKIADLVILDADPLASARNYRRIAAVIKDGRVVDLARLPEKPIVSAKRVVK
ncbi:MAG: amidohydrolase family protein [Gemmatimonadaceae bacterium]|nr:amidohydrolase family protein [Gemmatimonadaceae bacterium]